MATVSTIPTVKAKLVELLAAALDVQVSYCWPGPSTSHKAVFLGRHPELDDIRIDGQQEIPTIKAGRKQRQETYVVPVTCWTFRPDLNATAGATCEAEAFSIAGDVEDVLADNVTLGLGPAVHRAFIADVASTLFPFERGWACELLIQVEVTARLT